MLLHHLHGFSISELCLWDHTKPTGLVSCFSSERSQVLLLHRPQSRIQILLMPFRLCVTDVSG